MKVQSPFKPYFLFFSCASMYIVIGLFNWHFTWCLGLVNSANIHFFYKSVLVLVTYYFPKNVYGLGVIQEPRWRTTDVLIGVIIFFLINVLFYCQGLNFSQFASEDKRTSYSATAKISLKLQYKIEEYIFRAAEFISRKKIISLRNRPREEC